MTHHVKGSDCFVSSSHSSSFLSRGRSEWKLCSSSTQLSARLSSTRLSTPPHTIKTQGPCSPCNAAWCYLFAALSCSPYFNQNRCQIPPKPFTLSYSVVAPASLLCSCMGAISVHWLVSGSYRSAVLSRVYPSNPPMA